MTKPSDTERSERPALARPRVFEEWEGLPLPSRHRVGARNYALLVLDRYMIPTILGLFVVAGIVLAPQIAFFALVFLAMLSPMVVVHEWGHYRVARRAGLGVDEFSIGMGRRVWSRVSPKTGVRWSVKALPFGGSVTVQGMTVEQVEKEQVPRERAYVYAPIWTRIRLALAGVTLNFGLALVALYGISVAVAAPEYGVLPALLLGPISAVYMFWLLVSHAFVALLSSLATLGLTGDVSSVLAVPSGMREGMGEAAAAGIDPAIYYALLFAGLNLSLAVFNLLPLHLLDGSHALVAVLDGVRKLRSRRQRERSGEPFAPMRYARMGVYNKVSGGILFAFIGVVFLRDLVTIAVGGAL